MSASRHPLEQLVDRVIAEAERQGLFLETPTEAIRAGEEPSADTDEGEALTPAS